ncbi:molybdenum cofactor guanylyltransferase MobA [Halovulum dunhuangense]|uniref:Molybdenum cofactor guanylyltransferase n=1 Tax=Halovulum dunhuangense TaxID=1505036 RepID=A0A849KVD6_9RHOB|nr:molybdenum cofactor guanylyltransferase MobA [Halovulum dunhuangense]NNU79621.1 molybdenum cofactor guanylyltransferase MobA [Halovulum dunhuangense]
MREVPGLTVGVVLAGGLATRMGGGDKCLLNLAGRPMLSHVIDRLAPQVDAVVLNANGDATRFARFGLTVVADGVSGFPGPLAGVLAGMDAAAELGAEAIVTVAGDTPFFPQDLTARLRAAAAEAAVPIALAATPDPRRGVSRHPTFGLWPVDLRHDLRRALGEGVRKVVLWTDDHGCASAVFDTDAGDPFFNVNTPQDLEAARSWLDRAG